MSKATSSQKAERPSMRASYSSSSVMATMGHSRPFEACQVSTCPVSWSPKETRSSIGLLRDEGFTGAL